MQTVVDLVDVPLDHGVARLELDHRVARRFRWLVLLELAVALTVGLCALPVLVLLVVFGGGGELILPDLSDIARRAWVRWRQVHARVVAADGSVQSLPPVAIDHHRYARALAHLLQRSDAARVTVVERIGGGPPTAVWFGGLPMLQAPAVVDAARARRVLDDAGVRVESTLPTDAGGEALRVSLDVPQPGRFGALLALVLLGPVWVWTSGGRDRLAGFWAALSGVSWVHELEVDGDGLRHVERRGPDVLRKSRVDRTDLRGLVWGQILGDGPSVRVRGPLLRLARRDDTLEISLPIDAPCGQALRDLLLTAAHRLWHVQSGPSAMAHCPYCATLYAFSAGGGCPSCGAPPQNLHGLSG